MLKKILYFLKTVFFLFLGALFVFGVPYVVTHLLLTAQTGCITSVDYRDGYLFGINSGEAISCIFRYDTDTGKADWVRVPVTNGDEDTVYEYIAAASSDTAYLVKTVSVTVDEDTSSYSEIVKWTEGKKGLETVYSGDRKEGYEIRNLFANEDGLYVYYVKTGTGTGYSVWYSADGLTRKETFYDASGLAYIYVFSDDEGNPCLMDVKGNVTRLLPDGSAETVFTNEGSFSERGNINYRIVGDAFYYRNISSGKTYRVDLKGKNREPKEVAETYASAETFDDLTLNAPVFYKNTVKAGVYITETGNSYAAVCGETEKIVYTLERGQDYGVLLYIVLVILAAAILYVLNRLKEIVRRMMRESFVGRIIVFCLVMMVVGLLVVRAVLGGYMYLSNMQEMTGSAVNIAVDCLEILDMDEIGEVMENGFGGDSEWGGGGLQSRQYSTKLYFEYEGEFYNSDGSYTEAVPLKYGNPPFNTAVYNLLEKTLASGSIERTFYIDSGCQMISVGLSLEEKLDVPMVIVITFPVKTVRSVYVDEMKNFRHMQQILTCVFFVVVFCWLFKAKKESVKLSKIITTLVEGNTPGQTEVHGKNEFSCMIRNMNSLTEKMVKSEQEALTKKEWYSQFASLGLIRQLYREISPELFEPGDKGTFTVTNLLLKVSYLGEGKKEEKDTAAVMSELTEELAKLGGSVICVDDTFLNYVCDRENEECFRVISNFVYRINGEKDFRVNALLRRIQAIVRIFGTEDHRTLDVQFPDSGAVDTSIDAISQVNVGLAVNERMKAKVDGKGYHWRKIAYFANGEGGIEALYEVLDCCTQESNRLKTITCETFESGVDAFFSGDYDLSRNYMARVLRENNRDSVARSYLVWSEEREEKA